MSFTKSITVDGSFKVAKEIEGGPSITTDEVTGAFNITRNFAVLRDYYVPLTAGFDPRFPGAVFIGESAGSNAGGIYFFQRNYSTVPSARNEARTVAFALPG